jgi:hypothetical protein
MPWCRVLQQQLAEAKASFEAKAAEAKALRENIEEVNHEFQQANQVSREKQDVGAGRLGSMCVCVWSGPERGGVSVHALPRGWAAGRGNALASAGQVLHSHLRRSSRSCWSPTHWTHTPLHLHPLAPSRRSWSVKSSRWRP